MYNYYTEYIYYEMANSNIIIYVHIHKYVYNLYLISISVKLELIRFILEFYITELKI